MRWYIIAGEASGDLHGSNLVKGLVAEDAQAEFRICGGDLMIAAAGSRGTLHRHYRHGAVMGFGDVLAKASSLLGDLRRCKADILAWRPDVVVLIDYPGFNMRIARFCHRHGIKVFYYIAPKTWASREGRNRKLKAWVDRLFIVFPFEIQYFRDKQVPFIYEGNPLVDAIDSHVFVRPVQGRYVGMLPGSRKSEISKMMPVYMEAVRRLSALPQYAGMKYVIAGAPARSMEDYLPYIGKDLEDRVSVTFGRTYDILKFADAALVNSGTASLEAMLTGTPEVLCCKVADSAYWLAIHVLRVADRISFTGLGNLCMGRPVIRELIQDDFTVENVVQELRRLMEDIPYRVNMLSDYEDVRQLLGGAGASRKVARSMLKELQ